MQSNAMFRTAREDQELLKFTILSQQNGKYCATLCALLSLLIVCYNNPPGAQADAKFLFIRATLIDAIRTQPTPVAS